MPTARGPRRRRDPATLLPTLDDCFTVDIRGWKREGKLGEPNSHFEEKWFVGRDLSAILGIFVREDDVVLFFQRLTNGYDHLPLAEESVAVETTPNPVASLTRFVCPDCERRVYKLYAHKEVRFRCQQCVGLRPKIDRLSTKDRQSLRLEKINGKLGVPVWVPLAELRKPYWMHSATFEKLKAEKAALEASGIRELRWLWESVEAERRCRAKLEEKRDRRIKDGVVYLD